MLSSRVNKIKTRSDPSYLTKGSGRATILLPDGLLAGQSASFKINLCYPKCIIPCVLIKHSAIECAQICKDKCKSEPSFMDLYKDTHYFCNVGCVTSMCTNLSTEEDPAEEKLKGCVNSCSETCTKK
ncbi:hypothetical protein Ddye_011227 [Dipteronia dyeriana]|uniref:Uncharacterized protein n=1 Tax=Dipteronia dyeriana TaxID=168575 RepID=A0AAD9UBB0_9ROSI|nr:hypothetical protein Ddye_011227 [Dipteronia dyeriana]